MTRRRAIGLSMAAALAVAVATLPLSVALDLTVPPKAQVSAREVTGTVWDGKLAEAHILGLDMGDTSIAANLPALWVGTMRFGFRGSTLSGVAFGSTGQAGVVHLTGLQSIANRFAPLPLASIAFDDVSMTFLSHRCAEAQGLVRATLAGDVGGIALPGGLSGVVRCDGDALLLPLVGQSAMERIDLRVMDAGQWRADVQVTTSDAGISTKLRQSGFRADGGVYRLRLTGTL